MSITNTGTTPGRAKQRAKTAHINVRVTGAERGEIFSRARLAGMAPSAYMREAALLAGEKPVRVANADQLRQIHVDLKRIGNNLNQAARALNKYGADEASLQTVVGAAAQVSDTAGTLATILAKAVR
ncbi:plasmid mobilization protein [Paratractidigestivibacter sp.]|uniref:plasmid mobilization protein n=1 Tax=Paratractidigestivibacter sp. TaxID=2847316 RepID=UPI002AC8DDBF|nr:plasmid mobilization relaxosome protein MobC [Paratractidigestivibacter sp.]